MAFDRFGFFSTGSPRSQLTVPPAASIFSFAVFENPWALTESFFVSSPEPRILMSIFVFLISRAVTSVSGRYLRARLEAGLEVAQIDRLGRRAERANRHRVGGGVTRSFGSRMSIGIWPPSKPAGM